MYWNELHWDTNRTYNCELALYQMDALCRTIRSKSQDLFCETEKMSMEDKIYAHNLLLCYI